MNGQRHQTQLQDSRRYHWPFWPSVPLYPRGQRRTLRREIVPNAVWVFEQIQGIFYVVVPIRMTVVKLESGGLLVYAPVAPTPECLELLSELIVKHGTVQHIIFPTISGLEHKVFVGPFARQFPQATVWILPQQWSFPVNLPLSWLGFPIGRTHVLPDDSRETPFASQFDYASPGVIELGTGRFEEVTFFDRRSRTLLLTDLVIAIPAEPPEIVQLDPFPLLFHARDTALDPLVDTPENRRKGWKRICLFATYFRPGALEQQIQWGQVLQRAWQAPDRSGKNFFGLFPFFWRSDWEASFEQLWDQGRLFVAPVLQTLILNRAPQATLKWADRVVDWQFERIVPCHFQAPIQATADEFRQAFAFLNSGDMGSDVVHGNDLYENVQCEPNQNQGVRTNRVKALPDQDLQLLRDLNKGLLRRGWITPEA